MKKLLFVFTVAAFLTACSSGSTSTEAATDSTNVTTVDTTVAPAAMDTTHMMATDSTKTSADSAK